MTLPAVLLEVETPIDGIFVLDHSQIGGADNLAAPGETGLEWTGITDALVYVETFRGAEVSGPTVTTQVGSLNASLRNALDPLDDEATNRPGTRVRLRPAVGDQLWCGRIADISATWAKGSDDTMVSVSAQDAVKELANTSRNGAANPAKEYEPWPARFGRLLQSCPVPFVMPPVIDDTTTEWEHNGATEHGLWSGLTSPSVDGYLFMTSGPSVRTITGLTPGVRYRITTEWVPQFYPVTLTILGNAATSTGIAAHDWDELVVEFTATATSHTVTATATSFNQTLVFIRLESVAYVPQAANHETAASLPQHLDIAAASAGVAWFVNRDGVVEVNPTTGGTVAHFTDGTVVAPGGVTSIEYTDIGAAIGTAGVVNDLIIANAGRVYDASLEEFVPDDRELGPFTNLESIATYGPRSATLSTAIYTGPDYPYQDGPERLAAEILETFSEPTVTFSRVTFNALDYTSSASAFELYDAVTVARRGITKPCLIIAIAHRVTAKSWFVDLYLKDA